MSRADRHLEGLAERLSEQGFTLIEMMVALAIFSLAALALLRLEGATLVSTVRVADTTVAQIVARNMAVELMTDPQAPSIGTSNGRVTNGGQQWGWVRQVTRTDDSRIVRIDLSISDDRGRPATRLSLARPVQ